MGNTSSGIQKQSSLIWKCSAKKLRSLSLKLGTLFQYVDSLSEPDSDENTVRVLNFCKKPRVHIMGSDVLAKSWVFRTYSNPRGINLHPKEKESSFKTRPSLNQKVVKAFIGLAGCCRIWIPSFGFIAKPLHKPTQQSDHQLQKWIGSQ